MSLVQSSSWLYIMLVIMTNDGNAKIQWYIGEANSCQYTTTWTGRPDSSSQMSDICPDLYTQFTSVFVLCNQQM